MIVTVLALGLSLIANGVFGFCCYACWVQHQKDQDALAQLNAVLDGAIEELKKRPVKLEEPDQRFPELYFNGEQVH